ncbi:hypothetical protein [Cellulomonas sp. KRMCY2]|uniref:hypothetical protein n=1 Tax=Cellulomonas sp. KRMCY2 TaxID=1304865 RepID=UPI00045E69C5|nr:hypothetical protein [Cellulomonas sp. KRMCY2]
MSGTFDDRLRDLADRAAEAHASGTGFATTPIKDRARRSRRVHDALVVTVSVAALAVVGVVGAALVDQRPEPPPPAGTVAPSPLVTPSPSATQSPTTSSAGGPAIDGWQDVGADPAVFGGATISDAVSVDGRAVVVGCPVDAGAVGAPAELPVWLSDDASTWRRASGPAATSDGQPVGCLDQVVATPHGLFAHGLALLRSDDGSAWEPVTLDPDLVSAGSVDAVFAVGDRVTVLVSRASLAESTVASLYSTTDGAVWIKAPDSAAALFDDAGVADVVATADGLLAVGASPGGQLVPTAAAWVSADGLAWQRVTPQGAGFGDCYMIATTETASGFVAVGSCPFETGLMAVWSSPDAVSWTREESTAEQVEVGVAYLEATSVTRVGDDLYAAGLDYDASRPEGSQSVAGLWRSAAGAGWERVDEASTGAVPFCITELDGASIGFWPGAGRPGSAQVQVLTPVR